MDLELKELPVIKSRSTNPNKAPSLLKTLREKRKVSRIRLAKLARLSSYQIEGLEMGNIQNAMTKFLDCTKALGYETTIVLKMMAHACRPDDEKTQTGNITKSVSEKTYEEGSKLYTYLDKNGHFLGLLDLHKNSPVDPNQIHSHDLLFGIIKTGILTIDYLSHQRCHRKDDFFILPGNTQAILSNETSYHQTTNVLIFTVKYPR